jgi:peptide/nickel transport system ATP-binding protein
MSELQRESAQALLEIQDLRVDFTTYAGKVKVLNGVDLKLREGEIFGLVGESGCGKSVTALTVAGLLPENSEIVSGKILFKGEDLLKKSSNEMRETRAVRVAMIFQDPMTFLNPVLTIGTQLTESIDVRYGKEISSGWRPPGAGGEPGAAAHSGRTGGREKKRILNKMAVEALKKVRLPDPERLLKSFPHELSGGMRQRVMIAMALARNPDLLIADEITTALDVTIQAQILELLRALRGELRSTIVVITHDLGVVAEVCDRVGVMYAGDVVEVAAVDELFAKPLHPYTQGLLHAIPIVTGGNERLESVRGTVPDLIHPPPACRFNPRCPHAWDICSKEKPPLLSETEGHFVACHLYRKEKP